MLSTSATLQDLEGIPLNEIDAFLSAFATGVYPKYWRLENAFNSKFSRNSNIYIKKYPPQGNSYQPKF